MGVHPCLRAHPPRNKLTGSSIFALFIAFNVSNIYSSIWKWLFKKIIFTYSVVTYSHISKIGGRSLGSRTSCYAIRQIPSRYLGTRSRKMNIFYSVNVHCLVFVCCFVFALLSASLFSKRKYNFLLIRIKMFVEENSSPKKIKVRC